MLNKFFKFIKGYVIIEVSGSETERFVNICLRRRIRIFGTAASERGIILRIAREDFKRLLPIRRKCAVGIRITGKCGVYPFLKKYKRRSAFLVGAVLCFFAVWGNSCFIHTVEINGVVNTDINYLCELLKENGVYVGAYKGNMAELYDIKNDIISKTDSIAWLWVYIEGTKARVEVSERRIPPDTADIRTPSSVVSARDGVIKSILVKSGEARVSEGEAVSKGDELISGRVSAYGEGESEKYLYVRALGEVRAYTAHTAFVTQKLYKEERMPTGRHKKAYIAEIFGKRYKLYGDYAADYEEYDTKTECHELKLPLYGYVGLALTVLDRAEIVPEQRSISEEAALDSARETAREEIAGRLMPGSELLGEEENYTVAGDTLILKYTMSFIENIGINEPIGSEEVDKYTDRVARND